MSTTVNEKQLQLLAAALRTLGGTFDVPTLHLIFAVGEAVAEKGEDLSIGEVRAISERLAKQYQPKEEG
ncbi:MAG: hypothetical protein AAGF77_04135 [Bacteroidota bacterium]